MAATFRVRSAVDFARVERHASFLFSSSFSGEEGSGASFLRSASFLRFRMRCLYRAGRVPPWHAPDGRLAITIEREAPGRSGGWVSVAPAQDNATTYDDSWGLGEVDGDEEEETQQPPS
jgi:hypothetical protein